MKKLLFDWKYPQKDGWPKDDECDICIFECEDNKVFVGGYNTSYENEFYVNWGLGGAVYGTDNIIRWALLSSAKWVE